jgi:hypothetical protein
VVATGAGRRNPSDRRPKSRRSRSGASGSKTIAAKSWAPQSHTGATEQTAGATSGGNAALASGGDYRAATGTESQEGGAAPSASQLQPRQMMPVGPQPLEPPPHGHWGAGVQVAMMPPGAQPHAPWPHGRVGCVVNLTGGGSVSSFVSTQHQASALAH